MKYDANEMRPLPINIQTSFSLLIKDFGAFHDKNELELLRPFIEDPGVIFAPISNDKLPSFDRAYFLRNALKFMVAVSESLQNLETPKSLVDFGSGSGTATIASWYIRNHRIQNINKWTMVDQSVDLLDVAKKRIRIALESGMAPWTSDDDEISYIQKTISLENTSLSKKNESEYLFGSYILCELVAKGYDCEDLKHVFGPRFIVTDYEEILLTLYESVKNTASNSILSKQQYDVGEEFSEFIGQRSLKVGYLHVY